MNRYHNYVLAPHASSPSSYNQTFKTERHVNDERASLSGSEDGNYALYGDMHKSEMDMEGAFNFHPVVKKILTLFP